MDNSLIFYIMVGLFLTGWGAYGIWKRELGIGIGRLPIFYLTFKDSSALAFGSFCLIGGLIVLFGLLYSVITETTQFLSSLSVAGIFLAVVGLLIAGLIQTMDRFSQNNAKK